MTANYRGREVRRGWALESRVDTLGLLLDVQVESGQTEMRESRPKGEAGRDHPGRRGWKKREQGPQALSPPGSLRREEQRGPLLGGVPRAQGGSWEAARAGF